MAINVGNCGEYAGDVDFYIIVCLFNTRKEVKRQFVNKYTTKVSTSIKSVPVSPMVYIETLRSSTLIVLVIINTSIPSFHVRVCQQMTLRKHSQQLLCIRKCLVENIYHSHSIH